MEESVWKLNCLLGLRKQLRALQWQGISLNHVNFFFIFSLKYIFLQNESELCVIWVSEGYLSACPLVVFHLSLGLVTDPCQGTLQGNLISESHDSTVVSKDPAFQNSRERQNNGEKREVSDHLCHRWKHQPHL